MWCCVGKTALRSEFDQGLCVSMHSVAFSAYTLIEVLKQCFDTVALLHDALHEFPSSLYTSLNCCVTRSKLSTHRACRIA